MPRAVAGAAAMPSGKISDARCGAQVPSACFVQPPLAYVGATEEDAIAQYAGDIDVYVSKFKPMKNTISEREERTLMKLLVHSATDQARCPAGAAGCHLLRVVSHRDRPHACPHCVFFLNVIVRMHATVLRKSGHSLSGAHG